MNTCFIPARGGSKSIPKKNLFPILNRPLIYYCLKSISLAKLVDLTVLSTDCNNTIECVGKIAQELGIKLIVDRRPDHLATDSANVRDVIIEYVARSNCEGLNIILVQPTSPLLRSVDIDDAIRAIVVEGFDGFETISPIEHSFHAYNQRVFKENRVSFLFKEEREKYYRKQDKPKTFKFGNVIGFRASSVIAEHTLFVNHRGAKIINPPYDFDFDTADDVEKLASILKDLP
ncbi:NeuA CMP-N-acetylneuraminic acid synthetase [Burkholderiales bacterium]